MWEIPTHLQQEVPLLDPRLLCDPALVHVVHVLQPRALLGGDHLHQRGGRLGAAEDEPEAAPPLAEGALAGVGQPGRKERLIDEL